MPRDLVQRIHWRFTRPTYALPVDVFRILIGVLSTVYFTHLFLQVADFSAADGLIDHALTRQFFWYTRIGFFGPMMSPDAFRLVFFIAVLGSIAVIVGYRVRVMATILFLIAVSAYRWNFLVIYVDDAIMHLVLFWLILLPVGQTLVLSEWRRDRNEALARWKSTLVAGGTVNCFLVNVALIYLVAGLWKWTSPMWRDGTALYAALRMPISWAPDMWQPAELPVLKLATYTAMILEPLLPLMLILRPKSLPKFALLAGAIAFHLGIVGTMRIPYANLACLAAAPIVFRHEIMSWLRAPSRDTIVIPSRVCWFTRAAIAFVFLLTMAMAGEALVPKWRSPAREEVATATRAAVSRQSDDIIAVASTSIGGQTAGDGRAGFLQSEHNIFYAPLWFIGIAQSYRLFDWIDDRNFHVRYTIIERLADGRRGVIDATEIFPPTLRSVLLQGYLHGVTWGRVPREHAVEFRAGLATRFANRYCRRRHDSDRIEVWSNIERIRVHAVAARSRPELLMSFECVSSKAMMQFPVITARSFAEAR